MLSSPSLLACKEEAEIIDKLFCCIDNLESFLFDAGAGAGKTYALVKCLKHVVKNKTIELARNGQKVVCITYTNVAANEIIERLGISDIIIVSTIHDFAWEFIRRFQPELLQVHEDRVREEISILERGLQDLDKCVDLGSKAEVIRQVLKENRDEYLDIHYNAHNAKEYRELIKASAKLGHLFGGFLGNVARIKRTAKSLVDIGLLEDCIKSISAGRNKEVDRVPNVGVADVSRAE